jgi:hypothetical protein
MDIWSHSPTQANIPVTESQQKIILEDFSKSYKESLKDQERKHHNSIPLFGSWNSREEARHTTTFLQTAQSIKPGQVDVGTILLDRKILDIYMQELGAKSWSEAVPEPSHTPVSMLLKWNKSLHQRALKMWADFGEFMESEPLWQLTPL